MCFKGDIMIKSYKTKYLETDRLILKKGNSKDCIKVYEYDLVKCRGIAGKEVLEKVNSSIDFIGEDSELYYKECENNKIYDWFIYLKDGTPIGNITADRQIEDINSIEVPKPHSREFVHELGFSLFSLTFL